MSEKPRQAVMLLERIFMCIKPTKKICAALTISIPQTVDGPIAPAPYTHLRNFFVGCR